MKISGLIVLLLLSVVSLATDVPAGNISGVWSVSESPYVVQGNVRVAQGDSLIIEPGVEILFSGPYSFRVLGNLNATGAVGDSIVFKSFTDAPNWIGIKLDSLQVESDTARFQYCKFGQMNNGGINVINTSKVKFEDCRFHDNLDMYIGALYCALGNPSIRNCLFDNNDSAPSSSGAAMYIWDASPLIENTDFIGNQTPWSAGAIAIYRSNLATNPTFLNCQFINNFTSGSGGAVTSNSNCQPYYENCSFIGNSCNYDGGAIWDGSTQVGPTQYVNCLFEGNYANSDGGALYLYNTRCAFTGCEFRENYTEVSQGGAIYAYDESTVDVEDCQFYDNTADGQGGAMYLNDYSDATINRCRFINNQGILGGALLLAYYVDISITNSVFANNHASNVGGAIRFNQYVNPAINNCVFANNSAASEGGAFSLYWECNPVFTNSIFWGNEAGELGDVFSVQSYIWHTCSAGFENCVVEGGETGFFLDEDGGASCNACLEENPMFSSPSSGTGVVEGAVDALWKVSTESYCIEGGISTAEELGLGIYDLAGNARTQGAALDIGAYEGGVVTLPYEESVDLDEDGTLSIADLLVFLGNFGCTGDCVGDLNGDQIVNSADLLLFISLFSL